MPKKYRLSRADFLRRAREKVKRVHGTYFSLTVAPTSDAEGTKASCVVSKKIAAHAVDRNRIKRRCRESFRPILPHIREPSAVIFYAKREVAKASFDEIRRDITRLIEKAALSGVD